MPWRTRSVSAVTSWAVVNKGHLDFTPMDTTVADTLIGTTIDGRYRITGRVARGGMATVYTAVDDRLGRTVALKIIHPSQATNVHFVDRFADEAKTIARLTHPNVVAVYDQGRHQGLPYLVMEYVQGSTLRDLLTQRRRLTPVEALAILEQMLAAIAAAHRAGLVHRDVKPENVLVAEAPSGGVANLVDSVVKVADFGLARAVEAATPTSPASSWPPSRTWRRNWSPTGRPTPAPTSTRPASCSSRCSPAGSRSTATIRWRWPGSTSTRTSRTVQRRPRPAARARRPGHPGHPARPGRPPHRRRRAARRGPGRSATTSARQRGDRAAAPGAGPARGRRRDHHGPGGHRHRPAAVGRACPSRAAGRGQAYRPAPRPRAAGWATAAAGLILIRRDRLMVFMVAAVRGM